MPKNSKQGSKNVKTINNEDVKSLVRAMHNAGNWKIIKVYESHFLFFWYNIYKGILNGIGTFLGLTVVVAIFIQTLPYFTDIPVVGEIAKLMLQILEEYEASRGVNNLPTTTPTPPQY